MLDTMEQLWWRLQAVRRAKQREFRAAWLALREALPVLEGSQDLAAFDPSAEPSAAALLLRDNVRHRHDIERAYLKAIGEARREVVIANAYFIPGRRLRRALEQATRRGVRVRLLLQGKYEHFLQYHATRPVYQWLLSAGVEIHEYAPSALHAKVAVVDSRWATVGSTNLDPLSLLLAREANVVTNDRTFAAELRDRLDHLMCNAGETVDLRQLRQRPWHQRWLDRFAFGVMRCTLFLTGHRY
jgi:cardiolipin synthase A/B